jgi:hypothetical protein
VTEFSNISGNPQEPVVLIGDDPDHEGHVLISRLSVPESLPSGEVFAANVIRVLTETPATPATPDEPTHDDTAAQPGDAAGTDVANAAPASGDTGQ